MSSKLKDEVSEHQDSHKENAKIIESDPEEEIPTEIYIKDDTVLNLIKEASKGFPDENTFMDILRTVLLLEVPISRNQTFWYDKTKTSFSFQEGSHLECAETSRPDYQDSEPPINRRRFGSFYPYCQEFQAGGGLLLTRLLTCSLNNNKFQMSFQHVLLQEGDAVLPTVRKMLVQAIWEPRSGYLIKSVVTYGSLVSQTRVLRNHSSWVTLQAVLLLNYPVILLPLIEELEGKLTDGVISKCLFLADVLSSRDLYETEEVQSFLNISEAADWSRWTEQIDTMTVTDSLKVEPLHRIRTYNSTQAWTESSAPLPISNPVIKEMRQEIERIERATDRLWLMVDSLQEALPLLNRDPCHEPTQTLTGGFICNSKTTRRNSGKNKSIEIGRFDPFIEIVAVYCRMLDREARYLQELIMKAEDDKQDPNNELVEHLLLELKAKLKTVNILCQDIQNDIQEDTQRYSDCLKEQMARFNSLFNYEYKKS